MKPVTLIIALVFFSACVQQQAVRKPVHQPARRTAAVAPVSPAIPDSVCIAAVGDIMLGTSFPDNRTLPPDSARNSFANVADEFKGADITFGNLEGALLDGGKPAHYKMHLASKGYLFRMPVSYSGVLKDAGFNLLSLANNHIGDFEENGRKGTMWTLDSVGINYGGQLSHPSAIFKIKGYKFGFCAFAASAGTLSILDLKQASAIIHDLKQQCDVVIVSFHGGGEGAKYEHVPFAMESFYSEKRGDVNAFAHNAIDAGADVLLGNGPHVCRAMEVYKNRLIAYSLGNFCTYRSVSIAGICSLAPLLKVYVNKKGEFLSGRILSNVQSRTNGLQPDSSNRAANRIKMLTRADFEQPGLSINDGGVITPVKN